MSNKVFTEWANSTFHGTASEMSTSRLLKWKDVLRDMNVEHMGYSKSIKKAQCPEVEEATFIWFMTMQENSVALSNDIVIAAAKRFYTIIPRVPNEKELQFSHGWLDRFKKRFNIRDYTRHGENVSTNTSPEALQKMEEIKTIVSEYNVSDVFNMDETGLFYRLKLNCILATKRLSGKKKQKERITCGIHCKC